MKSLRPSIVCGLSLMVCYLALVAGQEEKNAQEAACEAAVVGRVPETPEEIKAYIKCCEETGKLSALGAAIAACSKLSNRCPPPTEETPIVPAPFSGLPDPVVDLFNRQLEEACMLQVTQACKSQAFAETLKPTFKNLFSANCSDILQKGPGIVVKGCEDVQQANIIFNEALEEICNIPSEEEEDESVDEDPKPVDAQQNGTANSGT